ncbi:hypothetical protein OIV83_002141 [Microbotryomycetes sp. JL201]|nr:hypothetical protein OIV83_002141 [Microbotryomycetes sp. JL201]
MTRAALHDLPTELLWSIHLLSLSSSLPRVSRHVYGVFHDAPPSHTAMYLTLRHEKSTLSHAIKYPVCTLDVVHALERIADRRGKRLRCSELPRRLVNGLSSDASRAADVDFELIKYLLEHYHASPNSKNGYILARAVFARHEPLVKLLLAHGADPSLKQGWAVLAAIGMGDLHLVKLLMDYDETADASVAVDTEELATAPSSSALPLKRRRSSEGGKSKRRRVEPRCQATSEMLEAAVRGEHWDIVTYLEEKAGKDWSMRRHSMPFSTTVAAKRKRKSSRSRTSLKRKEEQKEAANSAHMAVLREEADHRDCAFAEQRVIAGSMTGSSDPAEQLRQLLLIAERINKLEDRETLSLEHLLAKELGKNEKLLVDLAALAKNVVTVGLTTLTALSR